MNRLILNINNVNILGVCEASSANNRDFLSDKDMIIYAAGEQIKRSRTDIKQRHKEMGSGILSNIGKNYFR